MYVWVWMQMLTQQQSAQTVAVIMETVSTESVAASPATLARRVPKVSTN